MSRGAVTCQEGDARGPESTSTTIGHKNVSDFWDYESSERSPDEDRRHA